ncbi:MAG: hypothetical protein ACI8XO_003884 [Verrucomicrobiales bacterium]
MPFKNLPRTPKFGCAKIHAIIGLHQKFAFVNISVHPGSRLVRSFGYIVEGSSEPRLGSVTKFKPRIKVTVVLGDYLLVADLGSLHTYFLSSAALKFLGLGLSGALFFKRNSGCGGKILGRKSKLLQKSL